MHLAITTRCSTGSPVRMHLPGPSNSSTSGVLRTVALNDLIRASVSGSSLRWAITNFPPRRPTNRLHFFDGIRQHRVVFHPLLRGAKRSFCIASSVAASFARPRFAGSLPSFPCRAASSRCCRWRHRAGRVRTPPARLAAPSGRISRRGSWPSRVSMCAPRSFASLRRDFHHLGAFFLLAEDRHQHGFCAARLSEAAPGPYRRNGS